MIRHYYGKFPEIHIDCFVADSCDIIGDVKIGRGSSIWYNSVLRGDMNKITVGENTNVQDGSVIHVDSNSPAVIGDNVTIGHKAIIHGALIENNCLIGMGAIVLDNSVIGENSIVGAGALITSNKTIPPRSLVLGSPGKVIRELTDEEIRKIKNSAEIYVSLREGHQV
jgi:carbonic anhydrase/acetyltransferase-like protein (isoleucine patch superfamily)